MNYTPIKHNHSLLYPGNISHLHNSRVPYNPKLLSIPEEADQGTYIPRGLYFEYRREVTLWPSGLRVTCFFQDGEKDHPPAIEVVKVFLREWKQLFIHKYHML